MPNEALRGEGLLHSGVFKESYPEYPRERLDAENR